MTPRTPRLIPALGACLLAACTSTVTPDVTLDTMPRIYPDYTEVTVAPNLVAPRFWFDDTVSVDEVRAVFSAGDTEVAVDGDGRRISLTERQWDRLRDAASTIRVDVYTRSDGRWTVYAPFNIYAVPDSIDKFIVYRLIEPSYGDWNEMGIYQRCLESYRVDPVVTNQQAGYGCINCHSFYRHDPDRWLLQLRGSHDGTYIVHDGSITALTTEAFADVPLTESPFDEGMPNLMYSSWHPSGRYIAFSVNDTNKKYHTTDPNRVEVYDTASDVVVYDLRERRPVTSPLLMSETSYETYPEFSADGRTLYFCTADTVAMPEGYRRVKYSICSVAFDSASGTLGTEVDTLYSAPRQGGSATLPRISPDGRHMVFTHTGYGSFPVWHHDSDLWMIDLATGEARPLDTLNSHDTESYHSWSSNGRWLIYSSRRIDGLYSHPYIAYIDSQGRPRKPLLLPTPTRGYYDRLMKSYNIPEFVEHPVTTSGYDIAQTARSHHR